MDISNVDFERAKLVFENQENDTKMGELRQFMLGDQVRIVNKNQISYRESARFTFTFSNSDDDGIGGGHSKSLYNPNSGESFTTGGDDKKNKTFTKSLASGNSGKKKRKGTGFVFKKKKGGPKKKMPVGFGNWGNDAPEEIAPQQVQKQKSSGVGFQIEEQDVVKDKKDRKATGWLRMSQISDFEDIEIVETEQLQTLKINPDDVEVLQKPTADDSQPQEVDIELPQQQKRSRKSIIRQALKTLPKLEKCVISLNSCYFYWNSDIKEYNENFKKFYHEEENQYDVLKQKELYKSNVNFGGKSMIGRDSGTQAYRGSNFNKNMIALEGDCSLGKKFINLFL